MGNVTGPSGIFVSESFRYTIKDLMRHDHWEIPDTTKQLAVQSEALAIGFDLCNDMFIRPDGCVGGASIADKRIKFAAPSASLLVSALKFGSKNIAVLDALIPKRPSHSDDCQLCCASGKHPYAKGSNCSNCGGIGWVTDRYQF